MILGSTAAGDEVQVMGAGDLHDEEEPTEEEVGRSFYSASRC